MTEQAQKSRIDKSGRLTIADNQELISRCRQDLISYIDFAWLLLWETPSHAPFFSRPARQIAQGLLKQAQEEGLEESDSDISTLIGFFNVFQCALIRYPKFKLGLDRIHTFRNEDIKRKDFTERKRVEGALDSLRINTENCPEQLRLVLFAATRFLSEFDSAHPESFPISTEIRQFLIDLGATPTVAKQIAKIIRPDCLPKP